MQSPNRGNWIETFTGQQFFPDDPRPEEVDIRDIAASLSKLCRFNGHTRVFYSVAEHCVLMAKYAFDSLHSTRYALEALLHDGAEAYIGDMPKPVKDMDPIFQAMEDKIYAAVALRFSLPPKISGLVKVWDVAMLKTERTAVMPQSNHMWNLPEEIEPLPVTVSGWRPDVAELCFLQMYDRITGATTA
jgi:uncharacterized protein